MKKVFIHFADGFEEIEAITPVDVLRRAGCEVTTVSVSGNREVTSTRKVTLVTDILFEDADYSSADMILLPGGQPGADNLNRHEGLRRQISDFNSKGKWISAICAAPIVLGSAGVLNGKRTTCYPGVEALLTGAVCTGKAVETDGNIITGKGPGAALLFSLAIVEHLVGKSKAEELKKAMVVE